MKKFKKELGRYIENLNMVSLRVGQMNSFAEDAIEFIINNNLYPDFLKFQADKEMDKMESSGG